MPISITCECGKNLMAPDAAAGKTARCPECGAAIEVPDPVYDAEEAMDDQAEDSSDDAEGSDSEDHLGTAPSVRRKACPACGELIVATAVKCRFCGEVFDAAAARALAGSTP